MPCVLSSEESHREWSIPDFLKDMPGAGNIRWEQNMHSCSTVFWNPNETNQPESESQLQVFSEAEFETSEQPQSIQQKIKSLLLDTKLCGDTVLAQFWAPITTAGGQRILTVIHQPFGFGKRLLEGLCRFRYSCTRHQYSVSVEDTTLAGPPGRVFNLGAPEICPDVRFYSANEFPLNEHALYCGIRGYAAIPLFEHDGQNCVGVLEFVSLIDMPRVYFTYTTFNPFPPLEKYDLQRQFHTDFFWDMVYSYYSFDTADTICDLANSMMNKHKLPLIQAWVPCWCDIATKADSSDKYAGNGCSYSDPGITGMFTAFTLSALCSRKSVPRLGVFWVRNGRSLVEKAYLQNKACFVKDISLFSVFHYPLVPVIRETGLKACFAIPLQLIHSNFDPFILEIFLPPEQNYDGNLVVILLESLLFRFRQRCSTFQVQVEELSVGLPHWDCDNIAYLDIYQNGSSDAIMQLTEVVIPEDEVEVSPNAAEAEITINQVQHNQSSPKSPHNQSSPKSPTRFVEDGGADAIQESEIEPPYPNNNETEKNAAAFDTKITLDDIKQYFGGYLDDAAEKLRVSRSTLKRACRRLGIKKWPQHKRKKVQHNQSSPRFPTRFVEGGAAVIQESDIEPTCPNNNEIEKGTATSDTIPRSAKGKNIAGQDDEMDSYTMTVKATYNGDAVKFHLRNNSRIEELRGELDKRFKFEAERLKIKYEDEGEDDWILMSCDEDLHFCMDDLKSSGQTRMNVSIFPATL